MYMVTILLPWLGICIVFINKQLFASTPLAAA